MRSAGRPQILTLHKPIQVMPDITGLELAHELTAIRPGVPIILITGLGWRHPVPSEDAGIGEYMMKRSRSCAINAAIRRCLDRQV